MKITLPYPPSLNSYYRTVKGRILISKKGREYRKQVACEALSQKCIVNMQGRLSVAITAFMPDMRRRDLDNIFKSVLDALQHAGVYRDDSQIDHLSITRWQSITPNGKLEIDINEIDKGVKK